MAKKNKIKLTVHKEDTSGPQYSLVYKANLKKNVHYTILSNLVGDHDVVMVLSTDLFFGIPGKEQQYFETCMERVQSTELVYTSRKVPSDKRLTVFGLALERKKKREAQEMAVYIPNAVWRQEGFGAFLPVYGAQYYVTNESMDAVDTVEKLWDMTETEKTTAFVLDAFDISMLGHIGFSSSTLGEDALAGLLGL